MKEIKMFSEIGEKKLNEMAENSELYAEFLKFQGRIFKHGTDIAVEYFAQNPDVKFIATEAIWRRLGFEIADGANTNRFYDLAGNFRDMVDVSQLDENTPDYEQKLRAVAYRWQINAENAPLVKESLGLENGKNLLGGLVENAMKNSTEIENFARSQNVAPWDYAAFFQAVSAAAAGIIAGRLEVGGNKFEIGINPHYYANLNTFQKLEFLTFSSNLARKELLKIEQIMDDLTAKKINERLEKNDLHRVGKTELGGANADGGRGVAGAFGSGNGRVYDVLESGASGRGVGLSDSEKIENGVNLVPDFSDESHGNYGREIRENSEIRPDDSSVSPIRTEPREEPRGGAVRQPVQPKMAGFYEPAPQRNGDAAENEPPVADGSAESRARSVGLLHDVVNAIPAEKRAAARYVPGAVDVVSNSRDGDRKYSDEGASFSAENGVTEPNSEALGKLANALNNDETPTENVGVFDLENTILSSGELTETEILVGLTEEIEASKILFSELVNAEDFRGAGILGETIDGLTNSQKTLFESLRDNHITKADIEFMREKIPGYTSVLNLTETQKSACVKMQKLFDELGEISPFLRAENDVLEQDESRVPVVAVEDRYPFSAGDSLFAKVKQAEKDIKTLPNPYMATNSHTNWDILIVDKSYTVTKTKAKSFLARQQKQFDKNPNYVPSPERQIKIEAALASLSLLHNFKDIVENSVFLDSVISDEHSSHNSQFMHELYAPFIHNGKPYIAKLDVEHGLLERNSNLVDDKRLYHVKSIKIAPVAALMGLPQLQVEGVSPAAIIGADVSIAQLKSFVKLFDKDFYEHFVNFEYRPEERERNGKMLYETEKFIHAVYEDAVAVLENPTHEKTTERADERVKFCAEEREGSEENSREELTKKAAKQRVLTSDERREIFREFAEKHGLGEVFCYKDKPKSSKGNSVYTFAEKDGGKYIFSFKDFLTTTANAPFTAENLRNALEKLEKSREFFAELESRKSQNMPQIETAVTDVSDFEIKAVSASVFSVSNCLKTDTFSTTFEMVSANILSLEARETRVLDNSEYSTKDIAKTFSLPRKEAEEVYAKGKKLCEEYGANQLINDNQSLAKKSKKDTKVDENQPTFFDVFEDFSQADEKSPAQKPAGEMQFLDQILRDGGNKKDSFLRIAVRFSKDISPEEQAQFLRREYYQSEYRLGDYESGKGFIFAENGAEQRVSAWFDKDGIRLANGETARDYPHRTAVSWEDAAARVNELIRAGEYVDHANFDVALVKESKELAEKIVNFYRDEFDIFPDEWKSERRGFLDYVEKINSILKTDEGRENVLARVENDVKKLDLSGRPNTLHKRDLLLEDLRKIQSPPVFLPNEAYKYKRNFKTFITKDEVDAYFIPHDIEQKNLIISAYQTKDFKAFTEFYKSLYGIAGGNSHALGGADNSYVNYSSKGISFSRGGIIEPFANVNLNWSQAAARVRTLIENGKIAIEKPVLEQDKKEVPQEHIKTEKSKIANISDVVQKPIVPKKVPDTRQEKLYKRFMAAFPDITNGNHIHERYGNEGDAFEPLSVELLGREKGVYDRIGMMCWYVQEYDLMRDPDYVFKLDHEYKTLKIEEYQLDGVPNVGTVYDRVYDDNGNPDLKLQAALEREFSRFLDTIEMAERPLTSYKIVDENEVEQTIETEHKKSKSDNFVDVQKSGNSAEETTEKFPEYRAILNEFSERFGFGELNIEMGSHAHTPVATVKVVEKFADGYELLVGQITNPIDYTNSTPMTAENLKQALDKLGEIPNLATRFDRERNAPIHGILPLPKPPKSLPEISYAKTPRQKIDDNLTALSTLKWLRNPANTRIWDYKKGEVDRKKVEENLSRYSGWGGLSYVFDERFSQHETTRKQLKNLLYDEEFEAARESSLTSFYTPQTVIDAMYSALKNMDLPRNAKILEPSCGTGNFFRRLPNSLGNAEVTGVEIDAVTVKIARELNLNTKILHCGFEDTAFENDSFDLAIGNVPFGDFQLNDREYSKNLLIHDAFFRKALDKIAPGGVVAFVTSSGTLDKQSPKVREILAEKAELIGAIRLPNNAFSDAGTSVTSDIIFLQKRQNPLERHEEKPDWVYVLPTDDGMKINSYFVKNPQMILGKMAQVSGQFGQVQVCQPIENAKLSEQLSEAIKNLNAKITIERRERDLEKARGMIAAVGGVKNFTFTKQPDGEIYYRENGYMTRVSAKSEAQKLQLETLCDLREATKNLIDFQLQDVSNEDLKPFQEKLSEVYDRYVSEFGTLNGDGKAKAIFSDDADFPLIMALEDVSEDKESDKKIIEKAIIFSRRTINPEVEINSAETVEEALQISVNRRGKPDMAFMSSLMGKPSEEIARELLEKELVFIDPQEKIIGRDFSDIVERAEYLSGNVRVKLRFAELNAAENPQLQRNVDALKKVIPQDIPASQITVRMGCPWIEKEDYTEFLNSLGGRNSNNKFCEVNYSPVAGIFEVTNAGSKKNLNLNETTTYGTADFSMYALAEKILNQRQIVVKKEVEVADKNNPSQKVIRTVADKNRTRQANDKAREIQKKFADWIFATPERQAKYVRIYNNTFNSLVGREYDGSNLTFPGMNANVKLEKHQLDAVARTILGGNTLLAHVVGAGKSFEMFTSAMKKKQLGLIDKACCVVPKSLTEQTAREWQKLYPQARLLCVTNEDLSNENRRKLFTAKCVTGSYDAVIMSREQFEKLDMSYEAKRNFIQKELDSVECTLADAEQSGLGKKDFSVKQLEKAKKRLKTKLYNLLEPKSAGKGRDDLLNFEKLGFDYLIVDEAHAYKNGFVNTKITNVAGVTVRPSERAEDMQMKCDYFNEKFGDGHILMATGTPVSNSMIELYVMTRYLRPDILQSAGVSNFDDWVATFGNVKTALEQSASGTYKMKTRLATFANLPELMSMYKEFADVKTAKHLHLPTPDLKGGKPTVIDVPATDAQKEYFRFIVARAEAISEGIVEASDDNMLKISTEARIFGLGDNAIAALVKHHELGGMEVPQELLTAIDLENKHGKIDKCIEKVYEIYAETSAKKSTQIIFSDVAVNGGLDKFSAYDYIKNELIAKGIPENEICFAPKSDSKDRLEIFAKINEGAYRVVVASTGTLGTGANIQQKLCALHHLDTPHRPSDFEQREGRILRRGNENSEVEIFNYVTKDTLDGYLYANVTNKAKFIAQLLDNENPARVIEDMDEKVLTFSEIQALASSPEVREFIEVQRNLMDLTASKQDYATETERLKKVLLNAPDMLERAKIKLENVQKDVQNAPRFEKPSDIKLVVKDRILSGENAENYIKNCVKKAMAVDERVDVGRIENFEFCADQFGEKCKFSIGRVASYNGGSYSIKAGIDENSNNLTRLNNFFKEVLPRQLLEAEKKLENLEQNISQATQRIAILFPQEAEFETLTARLAELTELISDIAAQDGIVYTDDEEILETPSEKAEREKIYSVDDNDFQPVPDENEVEKKTVKSAR